MTDRIDVCKLIHDIPLFQGMEEEQFQRLASLCHIASYTKGQHIFAQGDPGKGFYVILSGKVKIFKLSPEGKEQILHIFGPGDPIGEVPVFAGETFPAYAEAFKDSKLMFFQREKLQELFGNNPAIGLNMLAIMAKRLRMFTRLVEDLSLRELPGRLAAYIMHLQDNQNGAETVELDISKGTLAKILGTSQETLSRTLKRMNEAGIISIDKRSITIINDADLEDLAEGYVSLKGD